MNNIIMLAILLLSTFCLAQGVEVKMQVDDNHMCSLNGGNAVMKNGWNKVWTYNAESLSTLACWFQNTGGPKGCLMTIDGKPTDPTAWKCTSAPGGRPNPDDERFGVGFDDSAWSNGVKINGPSKSIRQEGVDWWWGQSNLGNQVICRLNLGNADCNDGAPEGGQVKIRVDDELKAYVDGVVKADAFSIPGWQWTRVWTIEAGGAGLLAFRMYNQGGPGYGVGNMNNQDLFKLGMKCRTFPNGQNPDTIYPGWNSKRDFNEAGWSGPVAVRSWGGAGIVAGAQGFWGSPSSEKNALCRLKLAQPCPETKLAKLGCDEDGAEGGEIKIRVDDELKAYVDGQVKVDAFKMPGWQWTTIWTIDARNAELVAFRMFNQGGPGYGVGNMNNQDLFKLGMKCRDFPNGQNPDTLFPGWATDRNFNENGWTAPAAVRSSKGAGIISSAQGFWANPSSAKNAVCRLKLRKCPNTIELQVDDIHKVSVDGVVKSEGRRWNEVYSFGVGSFGSIAIYAENGGGPKGIMMKINGQATDPTKWKCQIVKSEADADSTYSGWRGIDYDDSAWTLRGKGINGPRKTKDLGPWWWSDGIGNRCICILNLGQMFE